MTSRIRNLSGTTRRTNGGTRLFTVLAALTAFAGHAWAHPHPVYEGTGTEEDGPGSSIAVDVRITVEQTEPTLVLSYQSAAPGGELGGGATFDVTISGTNFSGVRTDNEEDSIAGQISCNGTISGVATAQGSPLFIRRFTAECVTDCGDLGAIVAECREVEDNQDPDDPPDEDCDSVLTWIGADGDSISNPDSWDLLDAPLETDRLVFFGDRMNGGTVRFDQSAVHDSLDVIADFVSLDLNGQTLTLNGDCVPQSLSVQSDGSASAGALFIETTGSEGFLNTRAISVGDAPFDRGNLIVDDNVSADVSEICTIGLEGNGLARIGSALLRVRGDLDVADKAESQGELTVARGADLAANMAHPVNLEVFGDTRVGVAGVGTLTINDGTVDSSAGLSIIGVESTGIGTVIVDGSSLWQTNTLEIGRQGDGDLIIRNESEVFSTSAVLGISGGGGATLTSAGRWELSGGLFVGVTGPGNVIVDELSDVIADTLFVGPNGRVEGFVIEINPRDNTAGQKRQAVTQQVASRPGVIQTTKLVVEDGAQIIADSISLSTDGTLAGDGTLSFDVDNLGVVAPGVDECTTGTLTIAGDYVQRPEGSLAIKIGGTQHELQFDQLKVTGQVTLAGTVRVDAIDGFQPQPGETFDILTALSIKGTFDSVEGSGQYEANYTENSVMLTVLSSPSDIAPSCTEPEDDTSGDEWAPGAGRIGGRLCGFGFAPVVPLTMAGLAGIRRRRRWVG